MTWSAIGKRLVRPWGLAALAVLVVAAVVAVPPARAWYHLRAGRAALERQQLDSARTQLERCLESWPDHLEARVLAARAARRLGDADAAQVHLDEARRAAGDAWSEDIAFEWALARAALGDLPTVEESLRTRLASAPFLAPLILEALAEGNRRLCRMPEALQLLDRWLTLEPANAQAYFLRGQVHRQVGAVNRARTEYERAVQLNPEHRAARRGLLHGLIIVGRYQEALDHLAALRRQSSADPELAVAESRCRHGLGDAAAATQVLDRVLAEQPRFGPALRERGRQALTADEADAAAAALWQAADVLPFDYESQWLLAQALESVGQPVAAKTQFTKAERLKDRLDRINAIETREMTLRPFDAALREEFGRLLLEVGETASGMRWLHAALEIEPRRHSTHAALADHYLEAGETAKAKHHRRLAGA